MPALSPARQTLLLFLFAFAVLLLNICVPLIDLYTQPPIFGMKESTKNRAKERS